MTCASLTVHFSCCSRVVPRPVLPELHNLPKHGSCEPLYVTEAIASPPSDHSPSERYLDTLVWNGGFSTGARIFAFCSVRNGSVFISTGSRSTIVRLTGCLAFHVSCRLRPYNRCTSELLSRRHQLESQVRAEQRERGEETEAEAERDRDRDRTETETERHWLCLASGGVAERHSSVPSRSSAILRRGVHLAVLTHDFASARPIAPLLLRSKLARYKLVNVLPPRTEASRVEHCWKEKYTTLCDVQSFPNLIALSTYQPRRVKGSLFT